MPHLKAVQLISWGRSCSLDSYSLLAQLRVSKFFVAENGVYWCSHKTDKNCHFYGDKWWLDPIDRCFFKGTSTVFSDNLNISQFCLTFLCPGWNSPCALSLARWGSYSSELPAKVQLGWVVPIHWADLNSVFVRTLYSWLGGFIYTIYIYILPYMMIIIQQSLYYHIQFQIEDFTSEQAWSQAPLISGHATKRSCKAVSQTATLTQHIIMCLLHLWGCYWCLASCRWWPNLFANLTAVPT